MDLIYLDPPFNSRCDDNVIFKEADGAEAKHPTAPAAQIRKVGELLAGRNFDFPEPRQSSRENHDQQISPHLRLLQPSLHPDGQKPKLRRLRRSVDSDAQPDAVAKCRVARRF